MKVLLQNQLNKWSWVACKFSRINRSVGKNKEWLPLDFYRYIFINTKPLFGSVYFSRTQSTSELCMIGPKRFPNYLLTLRKQDDSNSFYSIGIVKQKQQIYLVDLIYW